MNFVKKSNGTAAISLGDFCNNLEFGREGRAIDAADGKCAGRSIGNLSIRAPRILIIKHPLEASLKVCH